AGLGWSSPPGLLEKRPGPQLVAEPAVAPAGLEVVGGRLLGTTQSLQDCRPVGQRPAIGEPVMPPYAQLERAVDGLQGPQGISLAQAAGDLPVKAAGRR